MLLFGRTICTCPPSLAAQALSLSQTEVLGLSRHLLTRVGDLEQVEPTIPHLTRSSPHRCLQRHRIGPLPKVPGDESDKKKFKAYSVGYFNIDIAEVHTEAGPLYLLVTIDRTSKFV